MAGAFLALGAPSLNEEDSEDDDLLPTPGEQKEIKALHPPWCWPTWQERTKFTLAPFPVVTEESLSPWKTSEEMEAVSTFVSNFWALSEADQINYIRCQPDNDSKGRQLWLSFFKEQSGQWKVNSTVDAVLAERNLDPYSVMKRLKISYLPELATSQITLAYASLGEALFDMERCSFSVLLSFILSNTVHLVLMDLAEKGERPDTELVRTWLKNVEVLTKILTRYGDKESLKNLAEQRETLSDVLHSLGIDHKGQNQLRLPKPLRDALRFLASEKDITLLAASIQEQLKFCDPDAETADSVPEFNPDGEDTCDFEWSEGVEEFKDMSEDDLWTLLGIPEQRLPFFNALQDPYGNHDPWTDEGEEWLKDSGERLALRWHQLVGVAKMVQNAFAGVPILLMDEVGLGKTIQITALIAVLAFYREYYMTHRRFPGKIGKSFFQWRSDAPNIPDLPVILVIPANLIHQFTSELHRYLRRGSFDILPYQGIWSSRPLWWKNIWTMPRLPEGRRILIIPPKALESDFDHVLEANNLTPTQSPRQRASYSAEACATVYGRRFLLVGADEAQNLRNVKKSYWALFALRQRSESIAAMTATPITNRPMVRDRDQTIMMANLKGDAQVQIPSLYRNQMLKWIHIIRQRFAGNVIRRSVWSVDNDGVRISGLAPFQEHSLLVKLYQHEVDNLELIARDLVEKGGASAAAKFAGGSWKKDASRKLDLLVEVLQHHLELDARAPLKVVEDNLVSSESANSAVNDASGPDGALSDKIVVYCAFPSSYTQIMKILGLHGIQALQIHGKISTSARTEIITRFKNSGRDGPRVLIISNDCLWSATDEGQLIGRIYRPPQQKTVHVYRLVAADTQDVFLNNLSFDKAAVLNAFTGATPSLSKFRLWPVKKTNK
ncbi:P-loop containing nucleoside triphosphate hydrolase protein [Suillus lakei]|nr:P-loop containing nucleoside triphosphate hydrolase protein [Suillus lakei]